MPLLQGFVSVPAGGVNFNVIAGSAYELPERNYYGRLAFTAEAAGESRLTVQIGTVVHLEESPVSRANRMPILPDDLVLARFPIPRFRRIVLKVRNTGAGANTVFWNLELTPA